MASSNGNICRVTGPLRGFHRSPVNSPHKGQWRGALMGFFSDLRPNKRLSKQSRSLWFETPSRSLWRYCNEIDRIVSRIDWSTLSKIDRTRREWMDGIDFLTHWGRATHICVSKLTIIVSDNGLSPGRRQAIIWANAGILLIGPLGTNFSEILIEIQIFSYMLKMASAKWRPFCLGLDVF